jgi:hypothetical protein
VLLVEETGIPEENCKDGNTSERERQKHRIGMARRAKINAFQNEKCKGNFYLII